MSFIDSTGLGLLVAAHKRLGTLGGHLRLVVTSCKVLVPLRLTELDRVLAVFPTISAAVGTPA